MDIYNIDTIGFIAATLTTISSLPQLISIIKTKNVDGISIPMFLSLTFGVFLWLIYGINKHDTPLIFANGISLFFLFSNLFFIFKYRTLYNKLNIVSKKPKY